MSLLIWLGVFFFGAIIGSFLNVVVIRKNTGESFVSGSSRCFSCGTPLRPWDMIPIVSFLVQKGRCRHCGSKISWQYPIVELITAFLAVSVYAKVADNSFTLYPLPFTLFYFAAFSVLLAVALYDIRQKIIDTHFLLIFGGFAVVEAVLRWRVDIWSAPRDIASSFFIAFFFYCMWLVSRGRWMGRGDADIAFVLALFLGFPRSLGMLLLAFWIGGLVGSMLLLASRNRFTLKSEVPFGPFLALATFLLWYFSGYFDTLYQIYFL